MDDMTLQKAVLSANLGLHRHLLYDGEDLLMTKPQGRAFDYILAGNGLFLHAANEHMTAVMPIAQRMVLDLPMIQPFVHLQRKLPRHLLRTIWRHANEHKQREVYYHVKHNPQTTKLKLEIVAYGTMSSVEATDNAGDVLFDIHSHNQMGAFLSHTDIENMQEFRIYIVIGHVANIPLQMCVAVGIYGHKWHLPADSIVENGTDQNRYKTMPPITDWPNKTLVKVSSPYEPMPDLLYPFCDVHDERWLVT